MPHASDVYLTLKREHCSFHYSHHFWNTDHHALQLCWNLAVGLSNSKISGGKPFKCVAYKN